MDDQSDDDQALVMSVTLHLLVIGRPFRLRALRRAVEHILEFRAQLWLTQPGAIARHFIDLPPRSLSEYSAGVLAAFTT